MIGASYLRRELVKCSDIILIVSVAETRDISLETVTMSTERKVDLTYEDILGLKTQRAIVLVDVRDHNEIQETGKLPDSIHIPLPELSQALQLPPEEFQKKYDGAELPLKSAPLVFSCRSGNRSRRAMNAALELGFAEYVCMCARKLINLT
ncbi:Hypothetical predicted protein [Cloeon dipterum]|uniref:Rhodanese domain-containing protein n=1 Tax=Cloeon dipterum TaxID=197152 RepID=A0A8S1DKU9_9INSE|nr:Hypothetical predicted protein [Cloeon dipterum]